MMPNAGVNARRHSASANSAAPPAANRTPAVTYMPEVGTVPRNASRPTGTNIFVA